MGSIICNFHSVQPRYELLQTEALNLIAKAHIDAKKQEDPHFNQEALITKTAHRYGAKSDRVYKRGCELDDFLFGATLQKRMDVFKKASDRVFSEIYEHKNTLLGNDTVARREERTPPQHMIHVTCTGYVSPSSAQLLVSQKNWGAGCQVTHAYHMGCFAAFPALRMAQGFLAIDQNQKAQVDIVHTEVCTLHFNPAAHEPEQFVIQSLFADGFIAYSVVNKDHFHNQKTGRGLEILGSHEEIFPNCSDAMTWTVHELGFAMSISASVPSIIAENIHVFLKTMFRKSNMDYEAEKEQLIFAIHPGGPKIIDNIKDMLSLSEEQISFSKEILYERGNMSSATIPHIWQRMLERNVKNGALIVSLAFGPGLTIAGSVLRVRVPCH